MEAHQTTNIGQLLEVIKQYSYRPGYQARLHVSKQCLKDIGEACIKQDQQSFSIFTSGIPVFIDENVKYAEFIFAPEAHFAPPVMQFKFLDPASIPEQQEVNDVEKD